LVYGVLAFNWSILTESKQLIDKEQEEETAQEEEHPISEVNNHQPSNRYQDTNNNKTSNQNQTWLFKGVKSLINPINLALTKSFLPLYSLQPCKRMNTRELHTITK